MTVNLRHLRNTGFAAAGLLVVLVLFLKWRASRDILPMSASQLKSMRASVFNSYRLEPGFPDRRLPDLPLYDVPPEHFGTILDSLSPIAWREPSGVYTSWQVLGRLECSCKDGTKFEVHLYQTFHPIGAFTVIGAPRLFRHVASYRGGTDQGIEDAVRNAYAAANEKK